MKLKEIKMDIKLENSFINFFMKCDDLERAKLIFNEFMEDVNGR